VLLTRIYGTDYAQGSHIVARSDGVKIPLLILAVVEDILRELNRLAQLEQITS
jgi:hypothetical protein